MPVTPTTNVVATTIISEPKELGFPPFTTVVTWENFGPLTTTFTAPASCSTIPLGNLVAFDDNIFDEGIKFSEDCDFLDNDSGESPYWVSCQPYGAKWSSLMSAETSVHMHVEKSHAYKIRLPYLSPGIDCPSGWSTANSVTLTSPNWSTTPLSALLLRKTGTHVHCCPSGYFSSVDICVSKITSPTPTGLCNLVACEPQHPNCSTPTPFSWGPGHMATTVELWMNPVYLIHEQSDLSGKDLSTADKIAIGVVVPVAVLLAVLFGGMFLMRKLRKKRTSATNVRSLNEFELQEGKRKDEQYGFTTNPIEGTRD